jgi:hypothetical protein
MIVVAEAAVPIAAAEAVADPIVVVEGLAGTDCIVVVADIARQSIVVGPGVDSLAAAAGLDSLGLGSLAGAELTDANQ